MTASTRPAPEAWRPGPVAAWSGLVAGLLVLAAALALPPLLDWAVAPSPNDTKLPPLHGTWSPHAGAGTLPAVVLAVLGTLHAERVAHALSWRWLLLTVQATALAWILALALVDGPEEISGVLGDSHEYLREARLVDDVSTMLHGYVGRISLDSPDPWPVHLAGHPPGAMLFFVTLVRLGLGGDLAAGLVVIVLASTTAVAVLLTLRALGVEHLARTAAPFLALTPAAQFLGVSADALFTAVVAWGLAALAAAAVGTGRWCIAAWSVVAGLLLGYAVMLSYGLLLAGVLALAVLLAARASWRPLPIAAVSALAVVLAFAAGGFAWWEAYPELHDRYWEGIAKSRPGSYWWWGNLGAILLSGGPVLGAGLGVVLAGAGTLIARRRGQAARPTAGTARVLLLAGGGYLAVALADASGMSKAEVERIWLPFVPWMTLALALLPPRWRRAGLAAQVVTALAVQHLVDTQW